jgi:hypothetical protein
MGASDRAKLANNHLVLPQTEFGCLGSPRSDSSSSACSLESGAPRLCTIADRSHVEIFVYITETPGDTLWLFPQRKMLWIGSAESVNFQVLHSETNPLYVWDNPLKLQDHLVHSNTSIFGTDLGSDTFIRIFVMQSTRLFGSRILTHVHD